MSGRRKRHWLLKRDSDKQAMFALSRLEAKAERRDRLARLEELSPLAFPLSQAQDIWTYRGVTCCIMRQSWWEKEAEDLLKAASLLKAEDDSSLLTKIADDTRKRAQNYNGYAIFSKRPLRDRGYKGFAQYVPVHGGITYAHVYRGGEFVYGFDTGHIFDDDNPLAKDVKWAKEETQRMVTAIQTAKSFERKYRLAKTRIGKLTVIDSYRSLLRHHRVSQLLENNTLALMNVLFGKP